MNSTRGESWGNLKPIHIKEYCELKLGNWNDFTVHKRFTSDCFKTGIFKAGLGPKFLYNSNTVGKLGKLESCIHSNTQNPGVGNHEKKLIYARMVN